MLYQGQIIKAQNSFYYVRTTEKVFSCKLRGRFKDHKITVYTGDRVRFSLQEDGSGIIEELLPRSSLLWRPPIANIDQIIIVFAAAEPAIHPILLNKFLVLAEISGIENISLCINKIDLLPTSSISSFISLYGEIGYNIIKASVYDNIGLDLLREQLDGRTTVVAGPSGVGKSSLLNALNEDLSLKTGDLSAKIQRGRHTTRLSQLFPLSGGGFIADTPGFSAMKLDNIPKDKLAWQFPEFRKFMASCYYNSCIHSHEPHCAVKDAVQAGAISAERYEAYLYILNEIDERKKEY